jgi:aminoglycoside phosphotransferase family enzyme
VEWHHGAGVEAQGSVDAVKARWDANIAELQQSANTVVDPQCVEAVAQLVARFLAGCAVLFSDRATWLSRSSICSPVYTGYMRCCSCTSFKRK